MGHFILKERAIVLHRADPNRNREPVISGDVGQLADGRLFARWQGHGEGGGFPVIREWRPGEDPTKAPRPAATDPWGWQRSRWESFRAGWFKWNRSDEPNERARFADAWPEVAAMLGIIPEAEHFLVETGDCYYPRDFEVPRWRHYLDRHAVGNYGLFGQHPEAPADESQAWIIGLQKPRIQARHAVDTGRGIIRSRWKLSPEETFSFPRQAYLTAAVWTVDIHTVYAAVGKRTLVEPVLHPAGLNDEPEAT